MNGVTFAEDGGLLVTDPDADAIWPSDPDLTNFAIDPAFPGGDVDDRAGYRRSCSGP
jgi:hypothetical protein